MDRVKRLQVEKQQQAGIKGLVTFCTYEIANKRAEQIDRILREAKGMPQSTFQWYLNELSQLCNFRELSRQNLVVQASRSAIMAQLNAENTTALEINYGALGTGSSSVAAGNTELATEVVRKTVASRGRSDSTLSLDFYYSKADWDGTAEEFGTFLNGTPTADSGTLFNRVLTGGWDKSATEALTVGVQFELNAIV